MPSISASWPAGRAAGGLQQAMEDTTTCRDKKEVKERERGDLREENDNNV